jgi:hypothetical protein
MVCAVEGITGIAGIIAGVISRSSRYKVGRQSVRVVEYEGPRLSQWNQKTVARPDTLAREMFQHTAWRLIPTPVCRCTPTHPIVCSICTHRICRLEASTMAVRRPSMITPEVLDFGKQRRRMCLGGGILRSSVLDVAIRQPYAKF